MTARGGRKPAPPDEPGLATKGAVYVEFLIAFLPMFCFFLGLVQFAFVSVASIMVKHAAEMTVRAAIVVLHDDPESYGGVGVGQNSGKRKSEIRRAALMMLDPLKGQDGDLDIDMKSSYGRDDMVEVKLTYQYRCGIPFGKFLVCNQKTFKTRWDGTAIDTKQLTGTASLPNQGADYIY